MIYGTHHDKKDNMRARTRTHTRTHTRKRIHTHTHTQKKNSNKDERKCGTNMQENVEVRNDMLTCKALEP